MRNNVEEIIKKMALTVTEKHLFNPYNQVDTKCDLSTAPGLRQNNLRIYLKSYLNVRVKEIWITDFMDQTTTKLSGIPLIAPEHLVHLQDILTVTDVFEVPVKKTLDKVESNLNVIWKEVEKHKAKPLILNIIPFYNSKTKNKDFTIDKEELIKYGEFLHIFIDIYKPKTIYATSKKVKSYLSILKLKSKVQDISL